MPLQIQKRPLGKPSKSFPQAPRMRCWKEVQPFFFTEEETKRQGYQLQHKEQVQLPPPMNTSCLFPNPYAMLLSTPSSTEGFHDHSCRLTSLRDQILWFLEGYNFKTGRRGALPGLKMSTSFLTVDSTPPSAALRHKETMGQDLQDVVGTPSTNQSSGCL